MRILLSLACLVALLAAACTTDGGATATPSPTATGEGTATAPPAATGTPAATATPTATSAATPSDGGVGTINAVTAAALEEVAVADAGTGVQHLVWSTSGSLVPGALWLVETRTIQEVDPVTGEVTDGIFQLSDTERILGMSSDGMIATTGADDSLVQIRRLYHTAIEQTLDPGGYTTAASFYGDNRVALVSGEAIEVGLWNVGSGERVGELTGFETAAPVYNAVVSEDGAYAAWVSRATLQFSEVESGDFLERAQFEEFIGAYAFSPDDHTFASAVGPQVQTWDPATGESLQEFTASGLVSSVAFSNAQPLLVTGGDGFAIWSLEDGEQVASYDAAQTGDVRLVSVSPRGDTLATIDTGDRTDDPLRLRLWRPAE
ncbi:MAG: WD40 repeat domain-containing protein [Dehalococcoidia bacterium]